MITASITLKNADHRILHKAISPELKSGFTRALVDIKNLEDGVKLEFKADDVTALRAAVNSYLRWLKIIDDIKEETKDLNNV
jgi:tRNA threonylcarbamoyladenosine modification (KEOPS) complex  Pcc1 subunit